MLDSQTRVNVFVNVEHMSDMANTPSLVIRLKTLNKFGANDFVKKKTLNKIGQMI